MDKVQVRALTELRPRRLLPSGDDDEFLGSKVTEVWMLKKKKKPC